MYIVHHYVHQPCILAKPHDVLHLYDTRCIDSTNLHVCMVLLNVRSMFAIAEKRKAYECGTSHTVIKIVSNCKHMCVQI